MDWFIITYHLKSGKSYTNFESINQKFVDNVYAGIKDGKNGVIQCAVSSTQAFLIPFNELSTVELKLIK